MIYIFIILTAAAAGEYLYFTQKLDNQRKQIIVLSRQNENLKSKANRKDNSLSSVNIKYTEPLYKNAYTTDNSTLFLSPINDSPIVFKIPKSSKVALLDKAELLNSIWYEISISSINNTRLKGWIKENEIKMMVEEASV